MATTLTYIGPSGSGLGFQMSGMQVSQADTSEGLLRRIRSILSSGPDHIIFVNERLAVDVMDEVEALNRHAMPTIVFVPDVVVASRLAADKMQRLMLRAVGSDIFSQ